jgi:hypothetical protein
MDLSGGNESEEQSRESKVFHKVAVCASLKWIRPVAKFICLRTRVSTVEGTSFWAVVPVGEGRCAQRSAARPKPGMEKLVGWNLLVQAIHWTGKAGGCRLQAAEGTSTRHLRT